MGTNELDLYNKWNIFLFCLLNSLIGNFIKIPLLQFSLSSLLLPQWIPITFKVSNDKIGEPDEPFEVLQKWFICSFLILSKLP